MDGVEPLIPRIQEISPETRIIYRTKINGDFPSILTDPAFDAFLFYTRVRDKWSSVPGDNILFEPINEWHGIDMDYKVTFLLEIMSLANRDGFCVIVPGDAPGRPDLTLYKKYAPIYEYILEHPCNAISSHAYGIDTWLSQSGLWLGYRHRLNLIAIADVVPLARNVPVYLTEVDSFDGRTDVSCEDLAADYDQYEEDVTLDTYVKGYTAFTLGFEGEWHNIDDCLPQFLQILNN